MRPAHKANSLLFIILFHCEVFALHNPTTHLDSLRGKSSVLSLPRTVLGRRSDFLTKGLRGGKFECSQSSDSKVQVAGGQILTLSTTLT